MKQNGQAEFIQKEWEMQNPQNPFRRMGTQFSIISNALAEHGFYDNMSDEEVLEIENLLVDITHGMNSVCGTVKVLSPDSKETSNELLAAIYEKTASDRRAPLSENEKMIQMAGKVKADEEDEKEAIKEWRKCLRALADRKGETGEMMGRMSDILKRLASGNSENKQLLNYVEQWNSLSIENARKYWAVLV